MGNKAAFFMAVFCLSLDADSIIYKDNPLLEAPYDRVPYYAVGLISQGGDYLDLRCTGIPIAPAVVLTNAYCLYNWREDKWRERRYYFSAVTVRDGGTPIRAKAYIVPKEFVDSGQLRGNDEVKRTAFDFGVMILEEKLDGAYASVFSVVAKDEPSAAAEVPEIPSLPIPSASSTGAAGGLPDLPGESDGYRTIVGYSIAYKEYRSELLRVSLCPTTPYWEEDNEGMKQYFYSYRCSTTEGMSGAPIFYRETDRRYSIIGIVRGAGRGDA